MRRALVVSILALLSLGLLSAPALAQARKSGPKPAPQVQPGPVAAPASLEIRLDGGQGRSFGPALNIVLLLTILSLAPALLISVTSFSRILLSLHFLRQALGTQTAPGNQTLIGLSLFLTLFVMAPVGERVNIDAVQPLMAGQIDGPAALDRAWPPLREFMLGQTRPAEIDLFLDLAKLEAPEEPAAIPARVLIPAFMVSELKTAFQIGIFLYLPFLMVEFIVSSVLLSLGMMQLPPVVVSTPIKLILFVVADGWDLVIASLVRSFGT